MPNAVAAMAPLLHNRFLTGFAKSFGVIMASEIGDKTFFIAAIMAMRNPRVTVFAGAIAALAVMTVLSAALGWAAPNLISKVYTHYAAVGLFLFFGLKSLYDAFLKKSDNEESELEQVEQELSDLNKNKSTGKDMKDMDKRKGNFLSTMLGMVFSQIFLKSFTLTFLAEWGDRSQIATIGLAASEDVVGVTLGGILGHALCTGAAVLGGRHLASHINEHTVLVFGGVMFLLFGGHALYTGP
ncbi:GDT1-like protein 5 [Tetrabaena socialis]|uniref:GDT1 family protein n=1 Tax=Tetrabaena socialis TaxID=47790 RepID=A0A2J8A2S8_9CHLO|nr:GDT1-like protein 5 [Tetrabaena socialis]|eukprot:PNH06829.1 GDT1-like protein 5 [Tetrabaena socialis]